MFARGAPGGGNGANAIEKATTEGTKQDFFRVSAAAEIARSRDRLPGTSSVLLGFAAQKSIHGRTHQVI
jgi:hypothetical protein